MVENAPVAGVVFAPARDEMYEASRGGGAHLNGIPIVRRTPLDRTAPLIPGPRGGSQELQAAGLDYTRGLPLPRLSAAQVATGKARCDGGATLLHSSDWDLAGAATILTRYGIAFEDRLHGPMRFNQQETRHGALATCAKVR